MPLMYKTILIEFANKNICNFHESRYISKFNDYDDFCDADLKDPCHVSLVLRDQFSLIIKTLDEFIKQQI